MSTRAEKAKYTLDPDISVEDYRKFLTKLTSNHFAGLGGAQRYELAARMITIGLGLCERLQAAQKRAERLDLALERVQILEREVASLRGTPPVQVELVEDPQLPATAQAVTRFTHNGIEVEYQSIVPSERVQEIMRGMRENWEARNARNVD